MNLITGATGLLGTHIALRLLQQGERVRAIRRDGSDLSHIHEIFRYYSPEKDYFNQIEWVEGDVLDIPSILDAMDGCRMVYHTAAIVSYHKADRKNMYRVNLEGTSNIVNCALEAGVEKLCHVSSVAALGKAKSNGIISEQTEWVDAESNTHYGITKHESEMEVYRGIEEGLNAIIVNPGFIIGPGDFSRSSASLFKKLNEGMTYYPPGGTGFVSAGDCADAIIKLMSKPVESTNYIVVAENLSMKEIFSEVSKSLGKKPPHKEAGKIILELARLAEWLKETITGKKALVTKETIKNASIMACYDNQKLKNTIDFNPEKISASIALTADYFKKMSL